MDYQLRYFGKISIAASDVSKVIFPSDDDTCRSAFLEIYRENNKLALETYNHVEFDEGRKSLAKYRYCEMYNVDTEKVESRTVDFNKYFELYGEADGYVKGNDTIIKIKLSDDSKLSDSDIIELYCYSKLYDAEYYKLIEHFSNDTIDTHYLCDLDVKKVYFKAALLLVARHIYKMLGDNVITINDQNKYFSDFESDLIKLDDLLN